MTRKELKELMRQNKASRIWNMVETKLKPAVYMNLQPANEEDVAIGQSKIGGLPDLPKTMEWFNYKEEPMSFLAQINLNELAAFDLNDALPKEGILYFFYDATQQAHGLSPEDEGASKVFFFKGDMADLQRKEKPHNLDPDAFFDNCSIEFVYKINMPNYESDLLYDIDLDDDEFQIYSEIDALINDYEYINKILGHADIIESGMELDCELVRNGLFCGDASGLKSPKAKALKRHIGAWHLLLQLDSNDETANMLWGEAGRLFFWIREEDLKQQNFEKAWAILQSY